MAITTTITSSFMTELLAMTPHTPSDTYKVALYTSSATLSEATTAYSATNECPNSGTYTAGGSALTGFVVSLDGTTAILDFTNNPQWTSATLAAAGCLIYNSTRSNKSVSCHDFGGVKTSTNGTFDLTVPAPAAATAVIRIEHG